MKITVVIISLLFVFSAFAQKQEWELSSEWQFTEAKKKKWYPAEVPGVVHLDLFQNELIEDPYWEDNEYKQRWIEEKCWVYKTTFNAPKEISKFDNLELIFKGLDTYADVFLNGEKILSADNMFREWKVDVKSHLKGGENELKVVFQSPVVYNKKRVKKYPQELPSGNEAADIKVKVASFTRKAAYHFGWDWGPRFITCGIWKPVVFRAWNNANIENVNIQTLSISEDVGEMSLQFDVEVTEMGSYEVKIGEYESSLDLEDGMNEVKIEFSVDDPKLWWCNGLGESHLYQTELSISKDSKLLDKVDVRYGIRTIELLNERDSIGTSFYFKLNGHSVFMQGANYIPQDMFLPRVTNERYEKLLNQVADANMNMIRVWGGGIYEQDIFYDLCDEKGILVWQDFMFAGSLYPDDPEFLENIREEAIQNVKRLSCHPCLALWCGNNEIDVAWKNWGWQNQYGYSSEDSVKIWRNYQAIFHDLLPDVVEFYSNLDYTPTSPLSNWGTPENFNHSSMHYWGVWHGREPFEDFEKNVGRFMVEYGFQSFPSYETLSKVIGEKNLSLDSDVMKLRQKSYIGNGLILDHIGQYYSEPQSFTEFIELSQQTQAKGMEIAIRAHKSNQPHCMGTLFWQLNDCWPGPSWSVIDFYGNPKVAYETIKEAYFTQP